MAGSLILIQGGKAHLFFWSPLLSPVDLHAADMYGEDRVISALSDSHLGPEAAFQKSCLHRQGACY